MNRGLALCLTLLPGCLTLLPGLAVARNAPPPSPATQSGALTPPAMCEAAIASAEAEARLPTRILTAISLRESGRIDPETGRVRPWPWTINFQGVGHFFETKQAVIAAVQQIQAAGGQSVDVGCMQVNLMHHPDAFATLEQAFDPQANATYAARFVTDLFASLGDWGTAIAAYHSRTPGVGEPYRDQVVANWNPKDPAVLAKLTFAPLPALPRATPGSPTIYVPFAQPGPIQISSNMAYRAFLPTSSNYQAFQSITVTYADFAVTSKPVKARGRPLDLRLSQGLESSGRALVVPKGIIEAPAGRPVAAKPAVTRPRDNG
jgi:hypothetical protein